jgi:saccharopine dehydrogenase-like NADP-dependent oxidoreductase
MKEKTLRYPGHAYIMEGFRTAGLFSEKEIEVKGKKVKPIDLTSKLLFECWSLKPEEKEFTVMRIELKDANSSIKYTILDKGDPENEMSSMARLTGFTCTAALRYLAKSNSLKKGILAPELLAYDHSAFEFIIEYLKNKGISIEVRSILND